MMSQPDKIMHLNILAPRLHAPLYMKRGLPVIYIDLTPTWPPLGETVYKGSDSVLRHQKRDGKRVGSYLIEIGSVAGTTQHAADFSIEKYVSVFVRVRKAPAQDIVLPIDCHQHAVSGVNQRQSGYVIGQVYLCSTDTLALQKIGHIRQRRIPKIEPVTFLRRYERPLQDRIPFGIWRRNRIDRNRSQPAIQTKATFQIGDLTSKSDALAQRIQDPCIYRSVRLSTKKRHDCFALRQILFEKILKVSPVEMREPMEFQARHPTSALLHLGNGRAGNFEVVGHLFLGHLTSFTRCADSAGELALRDSHG